MTTNIKTAQLTEFTFTGRIDVAASFKPDKDAAESTRKHVTLDVNFSDVLLSDIVFAAAKKVVVPFQNGQGRPHYGDYKSGQRVKVEFTRPASAPAIDPEVAMIARLQAMDTVEAKEKYIQELLAKAQPKQQTDFAGNPVEVIKSK